MRKMELLAPAGSMESLYAAVLSGADAVYLGGNKFSARAYASNFNDEALRNALDYCHLYGVKVYITLNTLIKEGEIAEAVNYIKYLYEIGVDALIVQDTGIVNIMKEYFPDFEIHASTQMTIHNAEGAKFLVNQGFKRIVLSRELSLEEIRHISKDKGIETEIFVHGALCICYSGQCLMSSLIGGRSGNRGRCAQPCRLPYRLVNRQTNEEKQGYLMSPKDICTVENLKDIIETGTSSLKIEGRMKRPEYVAGVVSSYRKAINFSQGKTADFNHKDENIKLLKLFNREGFSKAYMYGNTGKDMMAYSYPKNTGIMLGKVLKDLSIIIQDNISINDGIRYGEEGFTITKIIKEGMEVKEAASGDRVKISPANFKSGDILYKTSDIKLNEELSKVYSNIFAKKISLTLEVDFFVNSPVKLIVFYNNREYVLEGDIVQKAVSKPVSRERLEEGLRKTGDSPFIIEHINYRNFEEGFLPISSINGVRRELLESITNHVVEGYRRKYTGVNIESIYQRNNQSAFKNSKGKSADGKENEYLVCINSLEQLKAAEELKIDNVALDIFKRKTAFDLENMKCDNIYIKVPNIIREEFNVMCRFIDERLPYIKGIVTANLGIINRFAGKTKIIGDYKLNVFNSFCIRFFNKYVDRIPLSIELNKKEIAEVMKSASVYLQDEAAVQAVVYGKAEIMVSEYCPVGSVMGGKNCESSCRVDCEKGSYVLKDRKDQEFTILHDKFCRSYIYNSVPTNLIDNIDEMKRMNINSFRLDFVDEDYEETLSVLSSLLSGNKSLGSAGYTRGHYKRGVE